jgi:hypothetical protein
MNIDTVLGNTPRPTAAQLKAGLAVMVAVTETIREVAEVPSGHLYAQLCGKMSLSAYESMVTTLVNTGLVKKTGDMLKWTGPTFATEVK